jgi:hypothetical protein
MHTSTSNLTDFIEHARKKGMDHQTIRMLLLSAGWKEKDIAQAMTKEALDMPVPMPADAGGARDAFFHLLMFVSFFTTAISSITLLFSYINRWLPDAAFQDYYYNGNDNSGIRWGMASLIVAFPLFVWISRILHREMEQHVEKSASAIRRWLTYLTLFIAAATLMGDVITLVFFLLNGELTLRFILKVLVVLYVAGAGFYYFYRSMKLSPASPEWKAHNRLFRIVAIVSVAVVFMLGAYFIGSPSTERDRRLDEVRVSDLRTIQQEIRSISTDMSLPKPVMKGALPATLQDVQAQAVYTQPTIVDPVTATPYEYTVTGTSTFELCAVFETVRDQTYDIFWNHPAGRHCFNIDVLEPQR